MVFHNHSPGRRNQENQQQIDKAVELVENVLVGVIERKEENQHQKQRD